MAVRGQSLLARSRPRCSIQVTNSKQHSVKQSVRRVTDAKLQRANVPVGWESPGRKLSRLEHVDAPSTSNQTLTTHSESVAFTLRVTNAKRWCRRRPSWEARKTPALATARKPAEPARTPGTMPRRQPKPPRRSIASSPLQPSRNRRSSFSGPAKASLGRHRCCGIERLDSPQQSVERNRLGQHRCRPE